MRAFDKFSRFMLVALALSLVVGCSLKTGGSNGEPQPSDEDTAIYGTYDCWSYSAATGWIKTPNSQLVLSATSLEMAGTQIFPSTNPNYKNQTLHSKDGQIWMEAKVSGTLQTVYLYDYYLQDATAYGTPVLWVKGEYTNTATITSAPDPATASVSQLLAYVPVGKTPQQQPSSTKSVYAAGLCATNMGNNWVPYYWKDGVAISLPMPPGAEGAYAFETHFVRDKIYIPGFAFGADDGYWEDGVWHSIPNFNFGFYENNSTGATKLIDFVGRDTYFLGYLTTNGKKVPGYYKNNIWHALSLPQDSYLVFLSALLVKGSDVYATGSIILSSEQESGAYYWKNGTYHKLSGSPSEYAAGAYALDEIDDNLYVGGCYCSGNTIYGGYWKNDQWSKTLIEANYDNHSGYNVQLYPLAIVHTANHELVGYSYSNWQTNPQTNETGYFKDDQRVAMPSQDGKYAFASSLCTDNEDVYLGGFYESQSQNDGQTTGGYWKNSVWHPVQSPDATLTNTMVLSVALH